MKIDLDDSCLVEESEKKANNSCSQFDNKVLVAVFMGVLVGFGSGFALRPLDPSPDAIMWIGLPGEMFMRMIRVTFIPLIITSIIKGTASSDPKSNGKIGVFSLIMIMLSNLIGAILGIVTCIVVNPGGNDVVYESSDARTVNQDHLHTQDLFADMIRNLIPDNILTMCFQKAQTKYEMVKFGQISLDSNSSTLTRQRTLVSTNGPNTIGMVIVVTIVGIAASKIKESRETFIPFFETTSKIFISILLWFKWFSPVGVASLITVSIIQLTNLEEVFKVLAEYVIIFIVGIIILQLVFIPAVYTIVMRRKPFRYLRLCIKTWITVVVPPSTAVGVPDMMDVCENELGVAESVSRFVIPLGATVCRPGSCFFISLSIVFLTTIAGVPFSAVTLIPICILVTLGSLAIPSVPSSSVVTILIVCTAVNIDITYIGLLVSLEWLTDRLRTTTNSMFVILCTVVIDAMCHGKLVTTSELASCGKQSIQKDDEKGSVLENNPQSSNCDNTKTETV